MNIFFQTFGCKVNSCETAAMRQRLADYGFSPTDSLPLADAVVINSCTVTAGGDRRTRNCIRRARRLAPDAVILLTGCFPQAFPEQAAAVSEADIVTGNAGRARLPELLFRFLEQRQRIVDIPAHAAGDAFENIPVRQMEGHTRAFLKIEDGCDRFCRYCIVPYARGPVRSRTLPDIAQQAALFAENGYREIVLTGISLSSYGRGSADDLSGAVAAASQNGIERIRLSSLDPDLLTDSLIRSLGEQKKLAPHFHLSLQSGCDKTLRAMGRRYDTAEFLRVAGRLREHFDRPSFTTDVMAGYPGETEEDFLDSLGFISAFGFLKCHVFPYSPRPGTPAALLPRTEPDTAASRSERMIRQFSGVRERLLGSAAGHTLRVIAEKRDRDGFFTGYSDRYFPVRVRSDALSPGDLFHAAVFEVRDGCCFARTTEGEATM